MIIQKLRLQHRALQRYMRRIERIQLSPTDTIKAAMVADHLGRQIGAQWGVYFAGFLRRVRRDHHGKGI